MSTDGEGYAEGPLLDSLSAVPVIPPVGESTSRETAIAAGAAAIVKGWLGSDARVDAVTYAVACYDAFVAAQAVIPIEEHEAALALLRVGLADPGERAEAALVAEQAKLAEVNKRARWWMSRTAECEVDISLLRDRLVDARAALADTQHPSTPGGTESDEDREWRTVDKYGDPSPSFDEMTLNELVAKYPDWGPFRIQHRTTTPWVDVTPGGDEPAETTPCRYCDGTGTKRFNRVVGRKKHVESMVCPVCHGSARVRVPTHSESTTEEP